MEDKETGLEPDSEPEEDVDEIIQSMVGVAVLFKDDKYIGPLVKKSALKIYQAVVHRWGKTECLKYRDLQSATSFRELIHAWATGWDLKHFTVKEYKNGGQKVRYTLTLLD